MSDAPPNDARLPVTEHLRELRTRVIVSMVAIVVGFGVAWAFHEQIFDWMMQPYGRAMLALHPEETEFIEYRSLIEPVVVYLKTSLLAGFIAVAPFVFLQLWLFVVPGLYEREKKMGIWFLLSSLVLFYGGVTFCRYVVLDPAIEVLLGVGAVNTSPNIMMQEYFAFTSRMLLVFGVLFELPVAISFLAMLGIVTHRGLIRNWRIAVVGMFVVGAMLTPPDPLTQVALAVPMLVLYVFSIAIAYMITKSRGDDGGDESEAAGELDEVEPDA